MIRTLFVAAVGFIVGYSYADANSPVMIEANDETDARRIIEDAINESNETSRRREGR